MGTFWVEGQLPKRKAIIIEVWDCVMVGPTVQRHDLGLASGQMKRSREEEVVLRTEYRSPIVLPDVYAVLVHRHNHLNDDARLLSQDVDPHHEADSASGSASDSGTGRFRSIVVRIRTRVRIRLRVLLPTSMMLNQIQSS